MRKTIILLGIVAVLSACQKDACQKYVFIPTGVAPDECDEKCIESMVVEVEGKTVCACRTGWYQVGLTPNDPQTSEEWQTKMRLSAAQTEDDSIRIVAKALQLAFPVHVGCVE